MKNFTVKQFFLSISSYITNFLPLLGMNARLYTSTNNNHAKKDKWLFYGVFLFVLCINLSYGQDNPLAPAKGFNVMSYTGGASLNQGDIDGGLATLGGLNLRGAFTLSGHTAGSCIVSGDANSTSLIVEGPVSYTSGSGMNVNSQGYIKLKDMSTSKYWPATSPTRVTVSTASSQDANPRIEMSATQTLASINQDAFDFGGAFASFYNSSDTYKNCTSNIGVSTTAISSYTFNLTSGRSNFFKINGSNLDDFNEIKFNIVPSATNPAIITVDLQGASTFNWPVPNFSGVPNAAGQYILFNFVNGALGATINLNGGSTIVGTVFSPYFKVNKVGSGNIEGQVVCSTYTHEAGEVHYQVFNTTVNCSAYSSVTCDCAGNLLINPSFEINDDRAGYDSYYRTKGWSWTGAPAISTLYTNTGYSVCDSYNAFLYGGGGAAWIWQQVNGISVGTSYSLSAYGGTHEPAYDHRIRLVFYNSAGTALLTKEVQVDWDVDLVVSGAPLQEYKLSGTAPAGTSYLRVEGYASADYLKLDNFCLTVNNTCNNVTSGGTVGSDQTLCKNTGATDPAALTNVTSPSGGDTGVGLEYQWYSSTVLTNGACSTNMTGSIYSAISGATAATYDPGVITQTTCYIRASRRVNCSDYVGLSNAVKVVVKNNCTVTACANNLVQNGGFETDNGAVNSTTNTKFPVSFMSSPASYITQTNGVNTTPYLGTQPQYWTIGTDVNDYLNKNGAFYIDASSTGNAYSGDRFIWGRVNQCLAFSLPNQSLLTVTEGKKYRICAYVAAFNPTSSVQGDAKFVFETYFRNANNIGAGLLDDQYNWKSATADADGKWETLGWQQVCQDVTAPAGATALGFFITPSDDEGDGLAVDDVCITELPGTTPPTITNINKCGAGVSTITLGGCSGGTINWYDSMSNETAFTTGASYTTPSLTVSKTYYVSCTISGSESMKVPVSVILNGAVTGVSATPSATTTCGTAVSINGAGVMTNPNLVTNGSFTDGNIGFGTDYGFQNWTNGGYGVTTDASTYYTWASACKDRTASGTGNIFVADGALDAAAAVWYQTIPVKANTTYRLSTYASSIGSSSPAVLAFYVNGVKVGTSTTLLTTTCQWQQITTTWSSGSATSALFEIRNENAVVGGNDFALDDIAVTYENPTLTYSWTGPNSFTATTQNVSVTTAGTYTLTVSAPSGCNATASTTIGTCPCPTLSNASPSTTIAICAGATIPSLSLTSNLAVSGTMIEWCAFTSAQTNPYTSTATMYCLQPEANVINGTITATNLTGMPTIPGTYYVYGCLKPVPTDASCRPFVSYIVTVTANPIPVSVTGGTVCATGSAQSVPLSATCITGATPIWYSSQTSTTALATATNYNPSVSATTTYYVGCKLTASPNCETATGSRTAVTATVNPTPTAPTISVASGSSLSICSGSSTTLTASTCAIGSILWSTGATSSSITVSPTVNTTYTATCVASSCPSVASNSLTVTVTNNVTNGGTIAGNQVNCGSFDPVAFTNVTLPSGGNGMVEYVWMKSTTASTYTAATLGEWSLIIGSTGATYDAPTVSTTTYYIRCSRTAGCSDYVGESNIVSVIINPTQSVTATGTTKCLGETIQLSATSSTASSYSWSGPGTYTATLQNPIVTGLTAGTYSYTVTVTGTGGCTATANATVIINPIPVAPSVTGATICGSGSVNLSATCSTGQTAQWYSSTSSSTVLVSGGTYSPSVSSTTTYYVGCKDNTTLCETAGANRTAVTATVNSNPSSPNDATSDKSVLCSGESVTLSGTCVGGTAKWYEGTTALSSLTFTLTNTTTSQITKTYTVGCSVTSNGVTCETPVASRATVTVKVNPIPVAPTNATPSKSAICSGESITLNGSCSSGNPKWYEGTTLLSSTTLTLTNSTASPIIKTYTVGCSSSSNGNVTCETLAADRATVTVTVNPTPTAPTISVASGSSLSICSGSSTTLTASTCAIGSILWSTGATTSSITVSPTVNTTYTATCVASSCSSIASNNLTVTVTTNVTNGGTIAGNQVNCGAFDPVAFTNVTLPSGGNGMVEYVWMKSTTASTYTAATLGEWSLIIGSTGATYDAPTVSTTTYYIRCSRTAGCSDYVGESNIVSVIINPTQSVTATGTTKCLGETIQLSANSTTSSTYSWSGPGTYTSTLQNPIVTGLTAGTYSYTVTVTGTGGCTATANATVIINPIPVAPTVTGATICGSGSVNLSATCSTGQTAQWYSSTSSSTVLVSGSTYSPSVSSTTTYYVGCKDNTTLCETAGANRTAVTATVNSNPSSPNDATSDKSVLCSGESVTLSGTCVGGTAKWYEGTTALSSLTFTLTNTTTSQITKTYTVGCSVTSNGVTCETPVASRATVTVKVNPIPVAPTNATPSKSAICSGESITLNGSCSSGNPKWYEGTTLLSSTTLTLTNSTASPIIKTYTVGCSSSSNGSVTCETLASDRATVTVTVNPTPTAPTISVASGSSLSICSGSSTTLTASTCAIGSILWSTGATTSSITVSPTANTTYSATCVASSCSSVASNNLTVTVTTNVTNGGTIAGNQTNCGAFDPVAFTNVTLPSGGNGTVEYVWMKSTTASTYTAATLGEWSLIIGSTGATYDAPTVSTTTYYIRCSRTAGCSDYVGESNIVSVIINPTQSVTATGTTKCLGETIQLSANSTTSSTYSWSGPGTYTSTLQNPIVTGLTAGTYSYTVTVTGTGGCTATANATVIINPIPVAPTVTGATICGSGSVNLSATCSTGQTAQWYSSTSSSTVLVSGSTYSPSVSSTTTYYVGCKDNTTLCETAGANRVAVTATVNSNPLAPSDAAGSKAVICSGESVTLSGTCVGGTAKWYEGTTALSSLTFTLSNITTAQIIKTYTVGCSVTSNGATCETPVASRATVTVKVNPIPAAPTNAKSDKTEICSGETITLSGTCLSGTAKWYDGTTLVSNLTQVLTNTGTSQITKTYTVGCSESNGATCETAVADRATVTIKVNPIPAKPTGLTPATTLCGSGSVDLVATCSLGKVNWYNGTTKLTTSPVASGVAFPVTVSATTTYTASCVDDSKTTSCETAPADRVSTTITVNSNPLAPTDAAGSKAVICSGESVTLSGTCVGGTAKWYEGTTALSSLTFTLSNITTAQIIKTYTVGCSVTSNGATCETPVASRATVTVKVNPIPAAPSDAKSDKTEICSSETITLSGTCLSGTAKWYDGTTLVSNLSPVLTNTGTSQITKTYTVGCSESNGATCETAVADRATVTIKVNPIPAKPTGLTPATTLCGSGSVDLVATCSLGKVNWYNGSTKLTTSPVASGVAFPVTVSATTTYTASCVDDSKTTLCETAPADRVSTTITVNSNPLAPTDAAGSKAVICSGESVTLSGTCVGGTAKWYEGTTALSSLTFSLTNTTTAQITKTYTVGCSVTSNGATCETPAASRATVTVKVNPIPAAPANAKSDKTEICSGETIVLSGTCLSGTAKWYDGATLVSNLTQVLTNTTTAQTTKVFTVACSENNGATCETAVADRATVTVKINPIPAKPTGLTPATTLCGSGSVDLVATCSLGKVNWYNGTTKLTTSPVASGVAFPVTVSATTTYTASCVDDSKTTLCETAPADRVSTTITVNSNPLAPTDAAGSKAVICSGESVTLSGTCVGGTAKWYEGTTSLSSLTFSLTNTTNAQITKTFTVGCSVTSNGATCETPVASRATVTVKVNPIPAAPSDAKSDKTEICSGETITLSGTCLSGTAKWYDGATLVSNLTQVLTNTGTSQITKTYTVGCSESNGATCETAVADRATVTIKVNPIPAKPTGLTPATTLCGSGSVDLVATCSLGKVNWYNGSTKLTTSPVASGVAFPVTVSATTTYTASCVDDSKTTLCETAPADRVSTTITVNSNPLAPTDAAGSKAVICSGESVTLSGTCVGGTAKWYEGTTSLSSLTFSLTNTTTAQITKTYTVGCSVTSNGATCETPVASRATVTVKVNPIPAAPTNAKSDKTEICSGETITLSGTCLSGTAKWYDGTTLVSNLTQVLTNTGTSQITKTYTVACSESNGATCETAVADRATVTIKINPIPDSPTFPNGNEFVRCGEGDVTVTASGCVGGTIKWYDAPSAGNLLGTGAYTIVGLTTTKDVYAECVSAAGCTSVDRVKATATVTKLPSTPVVTAVQRCGEGRVTFKATGCANGTLVWYTTATGGTALASNTSYVINADSMYVANVLSSTSYYVECKIENSCVSATRGEAKVTITENVVEGGTIAADQAHCGSFDPIAFTSTSPATGGNGVVEYMWMKSTTVSNLTPQNRSEWTVIDGAVSETYDSPTISTTTYFIRCSRTKGCIDYSGETNVLKVTVNSVPTVSARSNSPVCAGSDAVLTAIGDAANGYTWTGPNGFNVIGQQVTVPSLTTKGTYKVTVRTDKGCTATDSISVLVNNNPEPVISAPAKICLGDSLHLSVSGGSTWSWTGTNFTSNVQSPVLKPTTAGTYNFSVTVSGTGGCTGTATTSVVVNALPVVKAVNDTICAGETGTLVASGASTYSWIGNGFSATGSSINVSQAGTYTVVGTDVNGCESSSTATLFINAKPSVKLTSNSPVCSGSNAMLTATGDAGSTYVWSGSNGFSATGSSVTIPNFTTSGNYKVVVTSDKGCIATDSITVLVNNNPEPVISAPAKICLGDSLHLSVSGGSTWSWTGTNFTSSVQSPVLKPTTAGTYNFSVTVSGTGGCTGTATTSVIVNALPVVKAVNDTICAGETGTLVASGASTYSWSGNGVTATGSSINVTQAGTYTVVGTDVNGCESSAEATLFINAKPSVKLTSNSPVCSGSNAMLTATGDAGSTYVWSGSNGFSATGSSVTIPNFTTSGKYKVVVTSDKGCVSTDSISVLVNNNPEPVISAPAKICLGDSLQLSVSGGSTWSWTGTNFTSNVQSPVLKPTTAGTYNFSVTVSGTGGCTGTATTSVIVNALPVVKAVNDTICAGETGTLVASGASTYSWSGNGFSATGSSINVTQAGTYTVVGTDVNGCESSAIATLFINAKPSVKLTSNSPVCLGSNAMLTATGDAGSTYAWSGANGFSATGSSVTIPNFTTSGNYKVVVTSDKGCVSTDSISVLVNNNPEPVISAPAKICLGDSLQLSVSGGSTWSWTGTNFTSSVQSPVLKPTTAGTYNFSVTVSGTGGCTGTATTSVIVNALPVVKAVNDTICAGETGTLVASGASTYSWSGNGFSATGSSINVTQAGAYTVVGTDVNGCESSATATLFINAKPSVKLTSNSPVCLGSNAMLTATGDAGSTYVWSGANGFSATGSSVTIPNFTTSGNYKVVVTSDKGCVSTDSITVLVNNNPEPVISAPAKICLGDSLHLSVSGGSTWSWTGTNFTSSVQSPVLKPTTAGTYNFSVTVSGTGGCTGTATTSVIVNALPVVKAVNDTICAGETGTLVASGASTYSWSGNGFSATGSSINVSQAGTYTVVGTDVNGCESSATATLFINAKPSVKLTSNSPVCLGSNAMLTATGDAGSTYAWSGANGFSATGSSVTIPNFTTIGKYKVVVTSDKGCVTTDSISVLVNNNPEPVISSPAKICLGDSLQLSVSGGSTWSWTGTNFTSSIQSPVLKPTTAGTYNFSVTVSGIGGCTGTATTSVIVNALPVVKAVNDTICAGETGTLVASGASTYSWSGNGVTTTGSSINVTQAGTYTVVGTDVNGCESSATATLFINAKPSVSLTSNSPVCSGSNAMLTATGNAGSSYVWSGANGFSATGSSVTIPNFTTSGNYKVVVTSDKGCIATDSISVLVNNNPEPVISAPAKICLGDSLHLSVSGGSTWSWTGTNFTSNVQSPVLKPTTAGTYNFSVTVSGTGGCTGTATTSVIVNALPVVKAVNDTICAGETGTLVASGASTYSWSGNGFSATGSSINVSQAGTYTVVGTDVNGCESSATATLFINAKPSVKLTSNSPVCSGSNAMLTATGDAGSTYVWSGANGFSATGSSVTILNFTTSGSYKVVVTSDKGCIATDSISVLVNNNPEPVISAPAKICLGDSLQLSVSGGSTWSWTGTNFTSSVQSPVLKPTTAGTYNFSVTVSGTGGCTGTATTSVIVNALPVVKAAGGEIYAGDTLTLEAIGAVTYTWTGPNSYTATGATPKAWQEGSYIVIGTDANGCKGTDTTEVTIIPPVVCKLEMDSLVEVCTGSVAMLSTSTSGNFTWTGPNNFTATGSSITISTNATASLNGLYIVKGTTSLGCVAQDTVRLVVKDNPSVQISGDSLMCAGGKVVLKVNAVGTYAWSGPNGFASTSDSAVVTKAGLYSVSVTNNGCVATGTKKVSVDSIRLTATAIKQALCSGDTLRLNALANAVSGVKSITWTNGKGFMSSVASPMISNVSLNESGTYTVTAVSNSGCTATATVEVVVNRTPVPVITAPSKICLGDSIHLSVNDGKVWSWTGSEGFTSELKNPSLLPTKAGTYTYTVLVAEAAGCTATATTKVIVNPLPIIVATGGVIYTGDTITLHVTGAVTYAWTGPNAYTATGATPKAWKGGIYTVIGTDSNGCKAVDTALVTVRPRISCKLTVDSLVEVCKNGIAVVHVSGADSYSWTGPNNFTATGSSVTISTNATAALNGLYIVKGTTSLGCVAQDTVRLVVKDNPSVQISGDSLMCAGGKVVLNVNAVGTYVWSGPNGFTSTSDSAVVTKAGIYSVSVTNNGCVATGTKKVSVDSISVTATAIKQALCSGDTLRLNALANAVSGVKSITWTNGKGFMSSVASPMISNVSLNESGTYTVTAVSNSGCTATATIEVVVNRTPVPVITAPSKICLGDSIHLSVNDGKVWSWTGSEGFTSELKNPSLLPTKAGTYTYTVLVAEAAGCTATATANVIVNPLPVVEAAGGSIFEGDTLTLEAIGAVTYAWTGPNTYTATGATPKAWQLGLYVVTGTDLNGCKGIDTTEVTPRVIDYCQIQLDSLVEVCKGSVVTLSTPTAGNYTWKGPNGFVATGDTITVSTNATTALNGWYVVTGETEGGCIILPDSVRLVVKDNPSVQINGDSLMCAGGKVVLKVNAVGTYTWSGPNGFTSTSDSAVVTQAGIYSVSVTNNGCVATGTKKVSVDSIRLTATAIKQALCSGDTLRLNALANAVSGVKSITWTNGKGFMSSVASPMISNVSLNESGTYTVTAVSNSGCTATATIEVVVNRTPVPVITAPSKICLGDSIHLSVNDGKVWSWTGSEGFTSELKNPSLLPTKAGTYTYTVLVAEAAGCTATATANVIVNGLPIVEAGIGQAIAGDTVELEAIGANTYAWTGPNSYTATGANPRAWQVGLYIVTGIDLNGCKGTDTTEITKDSIVCRLDVDSLVQVCVGSTAMLSTTSPGTYSWTGPNGFTATGDTITVSTNATTALNGWYYITGTTDGGCIASDSVQLVVKNNPSVQITGDSLLCVGGSNILSVRAVGTYLWTGPSAFTATTDSITVTKPGTYTVAVTNGGCTATGTINVKTDSVQVKAITSSASICTGGTITLSMNAKATSGLGLISWTHGDFATNDSVVVIKNITSADAGWYVATVVSRGGCNAVDSVNVTVNPIVTSDITVSVCKGNTTTLVAPSAATYLWNTGAKTATVSADTAGVYTVQMTDATGCISVRKFTVSTLDKPSATTISLTAVSSTCNGDVALNDGKIVLAGTQSTERYDMVEGTTYTGTANYASANVVPAGGVIKSSIANPTTAVTYTVRIFNSNDCYTDKIVTLQPVVCTCPPVKCAPYTIKKVKSARVN